MFYFFHLLLLIPIHVFSIILKAILRSFLVTFNGGKILITLSLAPTANKPLFLNFSIKIELSILHFIPNKKPLPLIILI